VVAGAGPIGEGQLGCVGERVPQQRLQVLHGVSVAARPLSGALPESKKATSLLVSDS
jgi:hypothetical protein